MGLPETITIDPSLAQEPARNVAGERSSSSSHRLVVPPPQRAATGTTGPPPPPAKRLYRVAENRWVTRDIAALDFLLNIPLQAESDIVQNGYLQQTKQQEEFESASSEEENVNRPNYANRAAARMPYDAQGQWWEKWISSGLLAHRRNHVGAGSHHNSVDTLEHMLLEGPTRHDKIIHQQQLQKPSSMLSAAYTPGRRLEGDDAVRIQIPLSTGGTTLTKQRSIARFAALREWERRTAHGFVRTTATDASKVTATGATASVNDKTQGVAPPRDHQPPLLDGRMFFSASGSYPVSVFSMIRYEPKREEAQLRRQKLEAQGGGGSQFSIPSRGDWRGISYRSLLPRREHKDHDRQHRAFNRFVLRKDGTDGVEDDTAKGDDDEDDDSSLSSEDSNVYVPGILDDPDMVLGRHRNVMVGDRVVGPIIASTIQFVEPALLKADLNKQFRERFDGWEPSKSALKYIGARVINGNYVLMDPVLDDDEDNGGAEKDIPAPKTRKRQSSTASSISSEPTANENHVEKQTTEKQIRMPPSLTLSKIRSLKHQALQVVVKANIEIGTLSLACVYFERLCLDCRVDKSNRRLSFAACLLLASKLNEPNVSLVMQNNSSHDASEGKPSSRFTSMVRATQRGSSMFASLLEFFTQEWEIGLKQLFDAEWGVFAALGFDLHAQPSQVAFHFKRFIKTLEWSAKNYLGAEMYGYWQEALEQEEDRRKALERRKARLQRRKETELLNLHIEIEHDLLRRKNKAGSDHSSLQENVLEDGATSSQKGDQNPAPATDMDHPMSPHKSAARKGAGMSFFHRFGMRRIMSAETLFQPPSAPHHPQQAVEYSHAHSLPLYDPSGADRSGEAKAMLGHHSASHPLLPAMATAGANLSNSQHHHYSGLTGLSDSAEAAMVRPLDVESGLLETLSMDSVAGSEDGEAVVEHGLPVE